MLHKGLVGLGLPALQALAEGLPAHVPQVLTAFDERWVRILLDDIREQHADGVDFNVAALLHKLRKSNLKVVSKGLGLPPTADAAEPCDMIAAIMDRLRQVRYFQGSAQVTCLAWASKCS